MYIRCIYNRDNFDRDVLTIGKIYYTHYTQALSPNCFVKVLNDCGWEQLFNTRNFELLGVLEVQLYLAKERINDNKKNSI